MHAIFIFDCRWLLSWWIWAEGERRDLGTLWGGTARWVVRHYSPAHLSLPLVCVQLKDDAVALADVLAPPDAILQSAIGRENGEVRQHRWPVKRLCLFVSFAYNNSKTWSQSAIHTFHSVFHLLLHSNFTQSSNSMCGQSLPRRKAHLMCKIFVELCKPVCILGNDCRVWIEAVY